MRTFLLGAICTLLVSTTPASIEPTQPRVSFAWSFHACTPTEVLRIGADGFVVNAPCVLV